MLNNYHSTSHSNDSGFDNSVGVDEHDIPDPLEHWSEQDFGDLVPSWQTL